ncbi:MAG: hypothetical protein Q8O00_15665, partial [Holophaga sp.]|nr:hypothetical protein [Holophaga sp.]
MPLARSLPFLSLGLICATLSAQDPAPKTTEKAPEVKVETTKNEDSCDRCESRFSYRKSHRHFHFGRRSTFGAYVQGILPLRDLKDNLDRRTGYGLGLQWTSDHGDWHGS